MTSLNISRWTGVLLAAFLLLSTSPEVRAEDSVSIWITSGSGKNPLQKKDDIPLKKGNGWFRANVIVKPDHVRQEMIGFGASMTESAAVLIQSSPEKNKIMQALFDPEEGIGINLLRLPMGACDFSTSIYSYMPAATSKFSIEHDLKSIIPSAKQALKINPSLKILSTPWSAPGWMKDNGSMLGVKDYLQHETPAEHDDPDAVLKKGSMKEYADYFVNYVQAYTEAGVPVYAVTLQNEPFHTTIQYPSMHMPVGQCIDFLKILGPAFKKADISTKILVWDHNYSVNGKGASFYPKRIYDNKDVSKYVSGTAWHAYNGNASVMGEISKAYPDKEVYFTEQTGEKGFSFSQNMSHFMVDTFYPALQNGAQSLMAWNIALNEKGGPRLSTVSWKKAQGLVTINSKGKKWRTEAEYAAIGHFSKFVKQGAKRIDVEVPKRSRLLVAAFRNPDKTLVLVVYHNGFGRKSFNLVIGDQHAVVKLGSFAAATILQKPGASF